MPKGKMLVFYIVAFIVIYSVVQKHFITSLPELPFQL